MLPRNGDLGTAEVAVGVAQRVLEMRGAAPYVVIAQYQRKNLDANRSRRCAFEDTDAGPFYDASHDTVRAFVDEIRAQNGGLGMHRPEQTLLYRIVASHYPRLVEHPAGQGRPLPDY